MNRHSITILGAVVTVLAVIGYMGFIAPVPARAPQVIEPSTDTKTPEVQDGTTTTDGAWLGTNALYVAEQRPGTTLSISNINIAVPGYVVIHESVDGEAGAIIGSSELIRETAAENIPVTLNRPVVDEEELIAMLHAEKGGDGFDPTIDLPITDTLGTPMYMIFGVSKDVPNPSATEVIF